MKDMEKREYNGLVTTRMTVESPDIMAESSSKIKVKTEGISPTTEQWKDETPDTPLPTTITNSL